MIDDNLSSKILKSIYEEVLVSGGLISKFLNLPQIFQKMCQITYLSTEGKIDQLKNESTAKLQKELVFFRNGNIYFSGM